MDSAQSGRAKTVLVFGSGEAAQAVCTEIVAFPANNAPDRLRFSGGVQIETKTQEGAMETILPFLDRLLENLGMRRQNYEISVANLGFASVQDIALNIRGFSADIPLFLAMLSASFGLPIASDLASTGHFSSPDGDIAMVSHLPEKLEAAAREPSIERFAYPSPETDISLAVLSPGEKERIEAAVRRRKGDMRLTAVRDAGELLETVLDDRFLILSALRHGFFFRSAPSPAQEHPSGKAVRHILRDNEARFWRVLEDSLFQKRLSEAKSLLSERIQFQIRGCFYPKEMGRRLLLLLRSIPPHILDHRLLYPLLPTSDCIAISQFAENRDHEDVKRLYDAVFGSFQSDHPESASSPSNGAVSRKDQANIILDQILYQIDPKTLSQSIGVPIDAARASFVLSSVIAESEEDFRRTVDAFVLHMYRRFGEVQGDPESVSDDAQELLEEAFSREGGYQAALAEAVEGIQGGMVHVLNILADHFKRKETRKRVNRVLKEYLNTWNEERKVAVTAAFLQRIGPRMPADLMEKTPGQCAHHIEDLVWTYVQSMEKLKERFRRI